MIDHKVGARLYVGEKLEGEPVRLHLTASQGLVLLSLKDVPHDCPRVTLGLEVENAVELLRGLLEAALALAEQRGAEGGHTGFAAGQEQAAQGARGGKPTTTPTFTKDDVEVVRDGALIAREWDCPNTGEELTELAERIEEALAASTDGSLQEEYRGLELVATRSGAALPLPWGSL